MTFEITLDDTICLIDPVVSGKISNEMRALPSTLDVHHIKRCDLILITSEESAYCEPETVKEIADRTYASVVAPKPALTKIDVAERFKVDVRTWDKFLIKGVDIEVVRAVHPHSQYPVGYIIKTPTWRIYHSGATYTFSDIGKHACDVALLPIGGNYAMDPFDAANACKDIRPKYAIPMGYNTIKSMEQDAGEFAKGLGERTKAIVLKPGAIAKLP